MKDKNKPQKLEAVKTIDSALEESSVRQKQKSTRKKQLKWLGIFAGLLVFGWMVSLVLAPRKGGMAYGICKVFLERQIEYPMHLRLSSVELFETSVRVWYSQLDSFGEYRLEPIQCYFKTDENGVSTLDRVTMNRRPVDQKIVDDFNKTLPAIYANPPDLTYPPGIPDRLKDMQIDTKQFRKPIL